MKIKKFGLIGLIICIVIGIIFFFPQNNQKETKKIKKEKNMICYEHSENKERYQTYQKEHPNLSKKEVITLVNMNRDFDFYGKIIKQEHPNDLNTIVNKYYQLDENYEPNDLVDINTNAGTYGKPYSKHTARKVVYDDFQALKQACLNKGFELYVSSGYRSTTWQKEIYNHMVETYSVERADETCSRPGHSEHTTGLGLDIALDQYKYEEVENHPQYQWFLSQLSNYGFILRYPKEKENLTGYSYEAWHIRYVGKELAQKIEKSGLTFDEYYARHF
ncbi:D-alanyl-D-alanine carboxypeptidase family protein [Coprobacillus sp. AF24-1LB]|nr:D-alanyl-D-alanine carboxypeptidase family protein [Coprobacillus sp. AF24-1LB]